jgi:hypothetical protein
MKRFLDDISVEVIEEKLLAVLGDILSPVKVFGMSPTLVAIVAGLGDLQALRWGQTRR